VVHKSVCHAAAGLVLGGESGPSDHRTRWEARFPYGEEESGG